MAEKMTEKSTFHSLIEEYRPIFEVRKTTEYGKSYLSGN